MFKNEKWNLFGDVSGVSVLPVCREVVIVEETKSVVQLVSKPLGQAAVILVRAAVQHHLSRLGRVPVLYVIGGRKKSAIITQRLSRVCVSVSEGGIASGFIKLQLKLADRVNKRHLSSTTRSVAVSALLLRIFSRFWIFSSRSDGSHLPFRMEAVRPRIRGEPVLSSHF